MKTLRIYETFSSVQGESSHAGRPCFFIRLSGCNLRCSYCDTAKAWLPESGRETSLSGILKEVEKSGLNLVEITGGEPMLQDAVPDLCRLLLENRYEVLMETNGSLPLRSLPAGVKRIIDWKTPSSGETEKMLEENFRNLHSSTGENRQ